MAGKKTRIMYIELKSGCCDHGPARIGRVAFSKSALSIYYQGRHFQRLKGAGASGGNYFDAETGEEYWISGPKQLSPDRHRVGGGTVHIDEDVAEEYWRDIRKCDPPKNPLISSG